MEEGLTTPSFPQKNLKNILSRSNPKTNCLPKVVRATKILCNQNSTNHVIENGHFVHLDVEKSVEKMVTRYVSECLASILTVISLTITTAKALDWKNCGGSKIIFDSIELDPLPLKFE